MSEQKMREALERIAMMMPSYEDDTKPPMIAVAALIAREALAQQPDAGAELTENQTELSDCAHETEDLELKPGFWYPALGIYVTPEGKVMRSSDDVNWTQVSSITKEGAA